MIRVLFLAVLMLISAVGVTAAPLDARIEQIISRGAAAYPIWGVYAVDADSGNVLADINGRRLLVPASNRKLVTTAMAARRFDPARRFTTELRAANLSSSGIVTGDLVFHASGDPSWMPALTGGRPGQSRLRELARQANTAGLRRVQGDLVIATGLFTEPSPIPPGWGWDNLADSYASIPAVFSVNANLGAISIAPGNVGQPLRIESLTGPEPFQFVNLSTTLRGGSAPTFRIERALDGKTLTFTGGLPSGESPARRSIPLGDPVHFNARLLREALEAEGIQVSGSIRMESRPARGDMLLASVEGAPMRDILAICNEDSSNFLAEMVYLLCAVDRFGAGSYNGAGRAEEEFWRAIGVELREVMAADGSGLSRKNAITAHALVELLREMRTREHFVESLPISGRTGTLRYRLSQDGMAGRVRAKTGTLDGVSGLSGYVTTNSRRTVVFSIMANNYTTSASSIRSVIDEIVVELASR